MTEQNNSANSTLTKGQRWVRGLATAFMLVAGTSALGYVVVEASKETWLVDGAADGDMYQMKRAIYFGANINSWAGGEALIDAARNGHKDAVVFLLDNGVKPDVNGYFALYEAAHYGHIDVVQEFLDRGVDINAPTTLGGHFSMLAAAAGGKQTETVKWLLSKGIDVTIDGGHALEMAASHGDTEMTKALLDAAVSPGAKAVVLGTGQGALVNAAGNGHTETVALLLERGADIHGQNDEAIRRAAANNRHETVTFLADLGGSQRALHEGKLISAARKGDLSGMDAILAQYPDILETAGKEALRDAAYNGQKAFVETLLGKGVNSPEAVGGAVIHAAFTNQAEIAELLLNTGVNLNNLDYSPLNQGLYIAAQESGIETVKVLLSHGADPENTDMAASVSPLEMVKQMQGQKDGFGEILDLFEEHIAKKKVIQTPQAPAP